MIKATFWDLDDTLIANDHNFNIPVLKSAILICSDLGQYSPRPDDVMKRADTKKRSLYITAGYSKQVFAQSFILTYKDICAELNREPNPAIISGLGLVGSEYVVPHYDLYPEAVEAVKSVHLPRYIMTMGDPDTQMYKINQVGIADLFDDINVVPQKVGKRYQEVLAKYNLEANEVLMIGNSLRHDMLPSLELGMYGAHLYAHKCRYESYVGHDLDVTSLMYPGHYHPITTLDDVLPLIERLNASTN